MNRAAATSVIPLVLAVAGLLVVTASPAAAATASVRNPSSGARIDDAIGIRVSVERGLTESVSSVRVRLVSDGGSQVGSPASLTCHDGCGTTSREQTWAGASFDPRAPRAFGVSEPLANGPWQLQASVNNSSFGGAVEVLVSYPPSPVSGLSASVSDDTVALKWKSAPEPDISGYRVERQRDGGSWQQVASLGRFATSHSDEVASPGRYAYRVVTLRPDGAGGRLTATSASVTAEVVPPARTEPSPTPQPPPTDSGGSTDPSSPSPSEPGSTTGPSGPSTGGGAGGDGGSGGGSTAGPSTSPSGSTTAAGASRRSGPRRAVAPPPRVRRAVAFNAQNEPLSDPQPQIATPETRYYGEDGPFAEELDYGGIDPVTGEPRTATDRVVVRRNVPGAIQAYLAERFDTQGMLQFIAAGLVLIALGFHAVRWMHDR